jgi:hypothetical protein
MRKFIVLLTALVLLAVPAQGQFFKRLLSKGGQPPERIENKPDYFSTPIRLIDLPTGSILEPGDFSGSLLLYEEGGALARLSTSISTRMMFGISYGGDYVIGDKIVKWNDAPSVHVVYRAIEESLVMPALVFGLDTQGYGKYWRESDYPDLKPEEIDPTKVPFKRYTYKSRGFYAVASKSYDSISKVGLHIGVNYSLETSDEDRDPNLFLGMNLQLGRDLALVSEYDFAFNSDKLALPNGSKGYLNGSVRWAFQPNMFLEFAAKNLLAGDRGDRDYVRVLKIVYYTRISRGDRSTKGKR